MLSATARQRFLVLLVPLLVGACASAAAPTPQVIYVTPEPNPVAMATAAPATPAPTEAPTAEPAATAAPPTATPAPTAKATPVPTPKPMAYGKLSDRAWAKLVKSPDRYTGKGYELWACISQFDAATGDDMFRGQAHNKRTS
jgi:hypothetical protein